MTMSDVNAPTGTQPSRSVAAVEKWTTEPTTTEIFCLALLALSVFALVIFLFKNYFTTVDNFGDSSAYMTLASAIRHWDFHGIVIKQFWGLPYAMAGVSTLTGLSDRTALLLFSVIPALLATVLAKGLWDGWIAGYFALLNFDWMQRSCLGGSEPLFVCLLFASFVAVRQRRWLLASLLASLATIVRPLAVFALLGIGLAALAARLSEVRRGHRRRARGRCALCDSSCNPFRRCPGHRQQLPQ